MLLGSSPGAFANDGQTTDATILLTMILTHVECRVLDSPDCRVQATPTKRYRALTIQLVLGGTAHVRVGGRWHLVHAPAVWLGYPGAWYSQRAVELPLRRLFLQCRGAEIDRLCREGLLWRTPLILPLGAGANGLVAAMRLVAERFANGGPQAARRAALALEDLLLQLAEMRGGENRGQQPASWCKALERSFSEPDCAPPSAVVLAQRLGIGASTLRRTFRAATGSGLHRAWVRARIELACAQLRDGASVASAAASAGFADRSHFARLFRDHCGCTPRSFRARHAGG